MDLRLEPFVEAHAGTVLGWVESAEEADRWASAGSRVLEPALLREWHADPEVRPYLCFEGERAGRIRRGLGGPRGRRSRARPYPRRPGAAAPRDRPPPDRAARRASPRAGFADVWLRVVPDNEPALAAYRAAGFVRTSPEEEASFNEGQPCAYVWMKLADG